VGKNNLSLDVRGEIETDPLVGNNKQMFLKEHQK